MYVIVMFVLESIQCLTVRGNVHDFMDLWVMYAVMCVQTCSNVCDCDVCI